MIRCLRTRSPALLHSETPSRHNDPAATSDLTDFALVHHGEARGIPCVELEIRQDMIPDDAPAAQAAWARRLARLLRAAAQPLLARP